MGMCLVQVLIRDQIDNDLVRKQLVINQGIDQTILIQDRQEAIDTMSSERLHNVKQCFSFNIRPGEAVRLAYGWGGGLSQSYQPAFKGSPRMKTDVEYQIKYVCPFIKSATGKRG